jgi:hypothetical protein
MKITWTEDASKLPDMWRAIGRENQERLYWNKVYQRYYYDLQNAIPSSVARDYGEWAGYRETQSSAYNLTHMVIESVTPTITRPMRVVVEPVGADYKADQTCKDAAAAVSGVFSAVQYWDKAGPIACRDGQISDIGTVLWYVDGGGEIRCINVDANNVRWHFDEGREPIHLYYAFVVPRVGLQAQFPKKSAAIEGMPEYKQATVVGVEYPGARSGDCVQVLMAVRRAHNGKPGKLVMTGNGGSNPELVSKEWKFDFFPSAHYRYDWDSQGFGGYSGARVLMPYHVQSNKLLESAYAGLEGAVPTILANEQERETLDLSTSPWRKVFYQNQRPEITVPKTVSDQVLGEISKLKDTAFFAYGQSAEAAQGLRPAGLNSAPAQREWRDIKKERLSRLIGNYAMLATDSARIIVGLASEAYQDKKILAKAPGTSFFKQVVWPKDLREDKYKIRFIESSDVPETVAGQKQLIAELRDRGNLDEVDYVRSQGGGVDVVAITSRLAATADYVDWQISEALEKCHFVMPDAMQGPGLDRGATVGSQEYQRAIASGKNYPRKNLECLRRLVQAFDVRRKGIVAKVPMPVPATLPGQPAGVAPMASSILGPAPSQPAVLPGQVQSPIPPTPQGAQTLPNPQP